MTVREIRVAGALVLGMAVAVVGSRPVLAQELKVRTGQKVAAQIIPADQEDEFVKGAVSSKAQGVVAPKTLYQTSPKYTAETLKAKIQGDVKLQAIIGVNGRVEKSRVKESLDPELDMQALKALDEWEFEAGRIQGQPARVLVEVVMSFRVH